MERGDLNKDTKQGAYNSSIIPPKKIKINHLNKKAVRQFPSKKLVSKYQSSMTIKNILSYLIKPNIGNQDLIFFILWKKMTKW